MVFLKIQTIGYVLSLYILSVLSIIQFGDKPSITYGELKCSIFETYIENDCNHCDCPREGGDLAGCTYMTCSSHQHPKYKDCVIGTTWMNSCNQCWCREIGTICTARKCPKKYEYFKCNSSQSYIENYCNSCTCVVEGTKRMQCGKMACYGTENRPQCTVGTTWNEACNQCWCLENMKTICTDRRCEIS